MLSPCIANPSLGVTVGSAFINKIPETPRSNLARIKTRYRQAKPCANQALCGIRGLGPCPSSLWKEFGRGPCLTVGARAIFNYGSAVRSVAGAMSLTVRVCAAQKVLSRIRSYAPRLTEVNAAQTPPMLPGKPSHLGRNTWDLLTRSRHPHRI